MLWPSPAGRHRWRQPILAAPKPTNPAVLCAAVAAALEAHAAFILTFLERPPQTNEVARAAVLLGGFLTIAAETRLPLRLCEIGASAGLNLHWDGYAYDLGAATWGPPNGPLRLASAWEGPLPALTPVEVRSRRGCDRAPIDPSDPDDRLRVLAYVWPDQPERRHRLETALDLASRTDVRIEPADAANWVEACLADPAPGEATVLFHSIVWQYLPADSQCRIEAAIQQAGDQATADAPLAWLRMEPAPDGSHCELRLTLWPGGQERLLAQADFHGRWIRWGAA